MSLRIATINVNGIRAAVRKGMGAWLDRCEPDVVTLQEVRAPEGLVADLLGPDWHVVDAPCDRPGRAGVAVASRLPLTSWHADLPDPAAGSSGRWLEATVDTSDGRRLTVVSSYCHTGEADDDARMAEKHAYLGGAVDRLTELRADGRHVLWTGDLNVAHRDLDLKNWKGNAGKSGCLPEERAWFDRLYDELGWVDLGRMLGGEGPGPYTWWSYRGRAYDNDAGWRIDHQIASPDLAALAKEAEVDRSAAYADRWSDHAPLTVTYAL